MNKFNKGDRIVFVEGDSFLGVKMPEGTLATYDDDNPTTVAPGVRLDTGERVVVWRDCIAHAEPETTADVDMWAAKDALQAEVAAEVFQTPAPLDPAKVKVGDPVAVIVDDETIGSYEVRGDVRGHLGGTWSVGPVNVASNGVWHEGITLTAHTPAPEPEPEWKPGTVADIEVDGDNTYRAIRNEGGRWDAENEWTYADAEVTDVRPLAVIDPAEARHNLDVHLTGTGDLTQAEADLLGNVFPEIDLGLA